MSDHTTTSQTNGPSGSSADQITCRLCDGIATGVFNVRLIRRHDVRFYRCHNCGSLQTETPYWLDEAYSNSNLAMLDTGSAQRNLSNLAAVSSWVGLAKIKTVIDIGGGDGLLCRLLRDYGIDARLEDKYAANTYAQGFDGGFQAPPVLYTAFEVLEHYANPKEDIKSLFESSPDSVMITTALYSGQSENWWYLTPDSGQHVFFYSPAGMKVIGDRYGYRVKFIGHYTIFTKNNSFGRFRELVARLAISNVGTRVVRSIMMLLPARGVSRDFELISDRAQ